jgi:metal-responsive CopG/Arc/MetJ family transcriptional regulator
MKKRKNYGRAPGNTQISLSIPKALLDKLDALADADSRTRSNFMATALMSLIEAAENRDCGPQEMPERKVKALAPKQESPKKTRTRHSPEQIKHILSQIQKGLSLEEACQKYGTSVSTLFRWKRLYA